MGFNTFGYNGDLQLESTALNKLLAGLTYEERLVTVGSATGLIRASIGRGLLVILTGRPRLVFDDTSNHDALSVFIPTVGAVFVDGPTGPVQKLLRTDNIHTLGLVVRNLRARVEMQRVVIDSSMVTADHVVLQLVRWEVGFAGTGMREFEVIPVDDDQLEDKLRTSGIPLTAVAVRTEIATAVRAFVFEGIPISPPGDQASVRSFDLRPYFDQDRSIGGVHALLYKSQDSGRGIRTDASNTIPESQRHGYDFAASIRGEVVLETLETVLDHDRYFRQGGTANDGTPTGNVFGYMVVPPSGTRTFHLPPYGAHVAIVASANGDGQVHVELESGSLAAHSRGRLRNLDTGVEVSFVAWDTGRVPRISIVASSGARLALQIDAVSNEYDADEGTVTPVIGRPRFALHDGRITVDVHYWLNSGDVVSDEGDATITLELVSDRDAPFRIHPMVTNVDVDLSVRDYLIGAAVVGWLFGSPFGAIVGLWLVKLVEEDVASTVTSNVRHQLNTEAGFPQLGTLDLPLFLDRIDVSPAGLVLSGWAEGGGQVLGYGRGTFDAGKELADLRWRNSDDPSSAVLVHLAWDFDHPSRRNSQVTFRGRFGTLLENPFNAFWEKSVDELPDITTPASVTLAAGRDFVMVRDTPHGILKAHILHRRRPRIHRGTAVAWYHFLDITWVLYRKRVPPFATLREEIRSTTISSSSSDVAEISLVTYAGRIAVATHQFYWDPIVRAAGLEQWTFDGMVVPTVGALVVSGMHISLVVDEPALEIMIDQTAMLETVDLEGNHAITFVCTDLVGTTLSSTLRVRLPVRVIQPRHPPFDRPGIPIRPLPIDPIPWHLRRAPR